MDTPISNAALQHAGVALGSPLRLPGETETRFSSETRTPLAGRSERPRRNIISRKRPTPVIEPDEASAAAPEPATEIEQPKRRSRRGALLATAALIAVGAAGSASWVFRDDLSRLDVGQANLANITAWAQFFRTTAQQASGNGGDVGSQVASTSSIASPAVIAPPVAQPAIKPADSPAHPAPAVSILRTRQASLADFTSLQARSGGMSAAVAEVGVAPQPARPVVAIADAVTLPVVLPAPVPLSLATPREVHVPLAAPAPASPAAPIPPAAAPASAGELPLSAPVAPVPVEARSVSPAPAQPQPVQAPVDPVVAAADPKAPLVTRAQQNALIGHIKEMSAQLGDARTTVANLQDIVVKLSKEVETRTADFETRLGLAETAILLASSARAGSARSPDPGTPITLAASSSITAPAPVRLASNRVPAPVAPASPLPSSDARTVKDYVIKGASPGLAVLAAQNPATGSPSVIQVGIGDQVPGVGRIKSIFQRGTVWVVQTENGAIQQ